MHSGGNVLRCQGKQLRRSDGGGPLRGWSAVVAGSDVGEDGGSSPQRGCVVYDITPAALIVRISGWAGSALLRRRTDAAAGIS